MMSKFLTALLIAVLMSGIGGDLAAEQLTISCGRFPAEHALCRDAAKQWASSSGHEVRVLAAPALSDDRLALYRELLSGDLSRTRR